MPTTTIVKEKVDEVLSCLYDRLVVRRKWIKFSYGIEADKDPQCCLIGGVGFCVNRAPRNYTSSEWGVNNGRKDTHTIHCLATAICELYPKRVPTPSRTLYMRDGKLLYADSIITGFNDHSQTTIDDVAKVIEKAREYEVINW